VWVVQALNKRSLHARRVSRAARQGGFLSTSPWNGSDSRYAGRVRQKPGRPSEGQSE
jgi:hypothetical protein